MSQAISRSHPGRSALRRPRRQDRRAARRRVHRAPFRRGRRDRDRRDVDGLNFFIVASGEAAVTVHGDAGRHARPGRLVRRGRARRQVGPVGDGDGDDADGGVRAPDLELPAVRRAAPGARLEAARDPRRATPRSQVPLEPAVADDRGRHAVRRGARRRLPRGRRRGVERARRALLPLRLGDRDPGVPPARRTTRRTSSRTSSCGSTSGSARFAPTTRSGPWVGQLTRNCCLDLLRVVRPGRAGRGDRASRRPTT